MSITTFRPQTDGFAFINAWTFDIAEQEQLQKALQSALSGTRSSLMGSLVGQTTKHLFPTLHPWIVRALPPTYGLCGGMAAAALDYYRISVKVPRGRDVRDLPTYDTSEGTMLRSFLLRRQLESMALNFPKLLLWMGILHSDLPFIDIDGPPCLLRHSMLEWVDLKTHIDKGSPWPLMLVGATMNPFHNHQVLAYGYDDPGDGTGTIYIYDMNGPDREHTIALDFRQELLQAEESCSNTDRGALRGFFCNVYVQREPPAID